jgi:Uma2 family endonuclease
MNLRIPASPEPAVAQVIDYPESGGEPMGETEAHILAIIALLETMRYFFRNRREVYVIADMFLYYEEGNPEARKAPDVMVVKGIDTSTPRRTFKIWEEKAVPSVIFEVTSRKTWLEDLGTKSGLYARLGVAEYFLFDPLREYLERPLAGYQLAGQDYVRLENAGDGSLISQELGVRLSPEGAYLEIYDLQTGHRVPRPDERADAAEAEVARLRALLAQFQGDKK